MAAAGLDSARARGRSGRALHALSRQIELGGIVAFAARWPLLFLLVPLPFYALSVAYGGVPIFIPPGGRSPTTTCATDCSCFPRSRRALALLVVSQPCAPSVGTPRLRFASRCSRCSRSSSPATPHLARRPGLSRGSPDQHAHPESTRSATRHLARKAASGFHSADVPRRSRRRSAARGNPARRTSSTKAITAPGSNPPIPTACGSRLSPIPSQYADYVIAFEGDDVWQAVQRPSPSRTRRDSRDRTGARRHSTARGNHRG